jgi:hypothetical protein
MYEVATRVVPVRSVLCLKRNVEGTPEAWVFGKEFVAILRRHRLPTIEGRAGAAFCIYWGEVSGDSEVPWSGAGRFPATRPSSSPPRSHSSPCAPSRRTARRSSTSVQEARSNRRSGSSSRSHCMVGWRSTRPSRVTWAPESRTSPIRPPQRTKVRTATSRFRSLVNQTVRIALRTAMCQPSAGSSSPWACTRPQRAAVSLNWARSASRTNSPRAGTRAPGS